MLDSGNAQRLPPAWGPDPYMLAPLLATGVALVIGLVVGWGDQLDQSLFGTLLGVVGVLLALAVPMYVEWKRRPRLRIEYAPEAEVWFGGGPGDPRPQTQIVQVRIVNKPMTGFPARWLLTHYAVSCKVTLTFFRDDIQVFDPVQGRWSATPQPIQNDLQVLNGRLVAVSAYRQEAVPQTLRFDLPPDPAGEVVAVALKVNNSDDAHGFSGESYAFENLQHPDWKLSPGEYEVQIEAWAGSEIRSEVSTLLLKNPGAGRGLELGPRVT